MLALFYVFYFREKNAFPTIDIENSLFEECLDHIILVYDLRKNETN